MSKQYNAIQQPQDTNEETTNEVIPEAAPIELNQPRLQQLPFSYQLMNYSRPYAGAPLPESFVDSVFGCNTAAAVQRFQRSLKSIYPELPETEIVDACACKALLYPEGKN